MNDLDKLAKAVRDRIAEKTPKQTKKTRKPDGRCPTCGREPDRKQKSNGK